MSTSTETMQVQTEGERGIRIERIFDAPREKLWRAFTERELIAQWWGRGNKLVVEKFEVERGGHWRFVEHEGGEAYGFEGRCREVTPPECLEWTFEWDGMPGHVSVDRIEFIDLGDGRTKIVNTSLFMTQEDRDGMMSAGMEQGLGESYTALDRLLASL